MNRSARRVWIGLAVLVLVLVPCTFVMAGAHTWDVNELFSNADGTIQFVEIREGNGTPNEINIHGTNLFSNATNFDIPGGPLTPPTTNKHVLFATAGFVGLPGAPTPDYIIPDGFFAINGDSVSYGAPYDTLTFGSGVLPTDGVNSLNFDLTTGTNSPTNYAGDTGSINLGGGCATLGDVDDSGSLDGNDIAAFVRAKLGVPDPGDNPACADYGTGTLAGDIAAFVTDLLSV